MSRFIAIDTDAGGLFVASGFAKGGSVRVERAVGTLDDPRPLSAANAPELARRLKALLTEAGIAPAPVLLCLGRDRVIFKEVRHPKTAPAEEPAVVRFQAQRELTEAADDVHMDYVPVPTAVDGEEDRRATVAFVRKDLYEAAKGLCEAAGLKLAAVTPRPFAAAAAARAAFAANAVPPPDDPLAAAAVLSVWDGGGEFVVLLRDRLLYSRSMSANALTSEAALVGETRRSLAAFTAQHPKHPVQAVYLAEGHSSGGSWGARLQSALPVPVYPFDPLAGAPADNVPPALRGRFVGPVGMLAGKGAESLGINFVTPRQPRAEPSKVKARALLGVLLLVGVVGIVGVAAFLIQSDLDKQIAAKQQERKVYEDRLAALASDTNRRKAVEEFRTRDVDVLDVLYDVADASPNIDKMRFKEFEIKVPDRKVEQKKPGAPASGALAGLGGTKPTGGAAPPLALGGAKPAVAAKPAEKKPAATLRMELLGADYTYLTRLVDAFKREPAFYSKPDYKIPLGGGNRQTDTQSFSVSVDLLQRKPTEFTRKLTAKFPVGVKPPAPVETPIEEGDQQ